MTWRCELCDTTASYLETDEVGDVGPHAALVAELHDGVGGV